MIHIYVINYIIASFLPDWLNIFDSNSLLNHVDYYKVRPFFSRKVSLFDINLCQQRF